MIKKMKFMSFFIISGVGMLCVVLLCLTKNGSAVTYPDVRDYGNIHYMIVEKNDGTKEIKIVGCKSEATNIFIPSSIENCKVTSIQASAFKDKKLESVTIVGQNLTIGSSAFEKCENLKSVKITGNIKSIGGSAFKGCCNLPDFPFDRVTNDISTYAFEGCTSLSEASFPSYLSSISRGAFSGCSNLSFVNISGNTSLYQDSFSDCTSLETVRMDKVVTIPQRCFKNCTKLNNVSMQSVIEIDSGAFDGCLNLESITIPNSAKYLKTGAFQNCIGLKSIIIPEGITTIPQGLFKGCKNLTSVTLPDSVTSMETGAFSGCVSLTEIPVWPKGIKSIPNYTFENCTGLMEITVSEGVVSIGSYAFSGCKCLESVDLPSSVKSIGKCAFYQCESMTDVVIPENVIYINERTFSECKALRSITIPDNLEGIRMYAFAGCTSLESIALPRWCSTLFTNAFMDCTSLESIDVSPDNAIFYSEDGVLIEKSNKQLIVYPCGKKDESYVIPDTIEGIGERAFSKCKNLKKIVLPNSINYIGVYAFSACSNLEYIEICGGVKSILDGTFYGCSSLKTIAISNSVSKIYDSAFTDVNLEIVYGYPNSYAQKYAGENGYRFYCLCNHVWKNIEVIRSSSCVQMGEMSVECVNCDAEDIISIPLSEHEFGDWYVEKESSCNKEGIRARVCLNCGEKDTMSIPSSHKYGDWKVETEATCLENGKKIRVCSECGDTQEQVIKSSGHDWEYGYTVDVKPTCTKNGSESIHCANCDATKDAKEIPATGHSYGTWSVTSSGSARTCKNCGDKKTITRVYGNSRFDTSLVAADQLKEVMGVTKFEAIVVASGTGFADALAGSYLASVKNAPVILTAGKADIMSSTAEYIKKNLAAGGMVYILGGNGAVPLTFESYLDEAGIASKRLAGSNRYDTNLLILEEAGIKQGDEILVCTGADSADSLSASATGKPMLLVPGSLTASQKAFLAELGSGTQFVILGGEGAVSKTVAEGLCAYGTVDRLAGGNRFETSVMIAERFFENPTKLVMAYSQTAWDGLSAGPLASKLGAPLILTLISAKWSPVAAAYVKDNELDIHDSYVLGGAALIDDETAKYILKEARY